MTTSPMRRIMAIGLLVAVVGGLCSCQFMGKNLSFFRDTVGKAQVDDVVVESGRGGLSGPIVNVSSPAIPSVSVPSSAARGQRQVVVQKGETLSSIARTNGVTLSEMCAANGLTSSSSIRSGQKLVIPRPRGNRVAAAERRGGRTTIRPTKAKEAAKPRSSTYTVKPGETLGGIANRHNTTVSAILKANGMKPDQAGHIRDGQKLTIPRRR